MANEQGYWAFLCYYCLKNRITFFMRWREYASVVDRFSNSHLPNPRPRDVYRGVVKIWDEACPISICHGKYSCTIRTSRYRHYSSSTQGGLLPIDYIRASRDLPIWYTPINSSKSIQITQQEHANKCTMIK